MKKLTLVSVVLLQAVFQNALAAQSDSAGRTMVARGDVNAISTDDNEARKLKRRSNVFQNDKVVTGAKSKTQLRMSDGGMISLKENSELLITEYQAAEQGDKGSVVLSLVKGGLRSITGAIKEEKGDYKLKTPVASIGIRGTHYEVELIDGELFLAVWDGAIDVALVNEKAKYFSLGKDEEYSYAKINQLGKINFMLAPPKNFEAGMSSANMKRIVRNFKKELARIDPNFATKTSPVPDIEMVPTCDDNKCFPGQPKPPLPPEDDLFTLFTSKSGSVTYDDFAITSEQKLSNIRFGFDIDFDNATIKEGELSFNDAQSSDKWVAVFDGNVDLSNNDVNLEVDITFAAHGDVRADGDISASFAESLGLETVIGDFELYETTGDNQVKANYIVSPSENSEEP